MRYRLIRNYYSICRHFKTLWIRYVMIVSHRISISSKYIVPIYKNARIWKFMNFYFMLIYLMSAWNEKIRWQNEKELKNKIWHERWSNLFLSSTLTFGHSFKIWVDFLVISLSLNIIFVSFSLGQSFRVRASLWFF